MKFENNNNNKNNNLVSEWEDNVLFDADDPDFRNSTTANTNNVLQQQSSNGLFNPFTTYKVPSTMSLASFHGPNLSDLCTPLGRSSISVSSSLSDLVGSPFEISADNVLTIEELRVQMGSCFTCGVSWTDDHVSLDCGECGGYSVERPCPLCDGKCGVQWKRDFTMSHASGKARWQGVCPSYPEVLHVHPQSSVQNTITAGNNGSINGTVPPASCAAASQLLAQELCARLEQLSASAQT